MVHICGSYQFDINYLDNAMQFFFFVFVFVFLLLCHVVLFIYIQTNS